MKKIFLVLLIFVNGCTSKLYLEIYNNSNTTLVISAVDEVQVAPGESIEVKVFTSTNSFTVEAGVDSYKYQINISELPGRYFIPGASHKLNLQIEPAFSIYIIEPSAKLPVQNLEGAIQPKGFPIKPNPSISKTPAAVINQL